MKNKICWVLLVSLILCFIFCYTTVKQHEFSSQLEIEKVKKELSLSLNKIDSLNKEMDNLNNKYDSLLTEKRKVYVQRINDYRFMGIDSNIIVLSGFLSKEIIFE